MIIKQDKKTSYEKIIDLTDDKINVLLLGTSGCGKSTLINSVLQKDVALTGNWKRTTSEIRVYESDHIPFRMIDTIGFEYDFFNQMKIKNELKKFSKQSIKDANVEHIFHAIWFCIDATSKRIDKKVIDYIRDISKMWKNIPIIIVFTKSYSDVEKNENILKFNMELNTYKHRNELNIKTVIPVVARSLAITENYVVPSSGLDALIKETILLVPEAKSVSIGSIKSIDLKIKRGMANSLVAATTTAAGAVGALPMPTPDAMILTPMQGMMFKSIAEIYDVKDDKMINSVINELIKAGATAMVGKTLINALKAVPIAGSVLNAVVAGCITAISGEVCVATFEKVYTHELDVSSIDFSNRIADLFKRYLPVFMSQIKPYIDTGDFNSLLLNLGTLFLSKNKE